MSKQARKRQTVELIVRLSVIALAILACSGVAQAEPPTLWIEQAGTSGLDQATSVAAVGGNVYVAGYSSGDFGGPSEGVNDVILMKYDSAGVEQWAQQIGTGREDYAHDIAVDAVGNSYITGETAGNLYGPNAGLAWDDVFLAKYDTNGAFQWGRQLGVPDHDRL